MKIKLFLLICFYFLIFVTIAPSQHQSSLYIPKEIKNAYVKGTRSLDGKPGSNYWQNKSEYIIYTSIDPKTKTLKGSETIIYYNNSPDALDKLVIRLYPDWNKPGTGRDWNVAELSLGGGVTINSLKLNGVSVNLLNDNIAHSGTNLHLYLDEQLEPLSVLKLEIDWKFVIPDAPYPRMGAYDSTSYMVAMWYPQISVYDDLFGWDEIEYSGRTEFYNDFNNYDVHITVPNTFCVWATGELQNTEQIFGPLILKRYNEATTSDKVVNIITEKDYLLKMAMFNSSEATNTWHFKAQNVPDFVFACSDHYLWDAVSLELNPEKRSYTGRVLISAAYSPNSWDFPYVAEISRSVIDYFSHEFPKVPFPYPRLTVFNGSGGMEFPMMVNDGTAESMNGTIGVTAHEIAHTYFPFYMGINERRFAWMDEGIAVFLPVEIQKRLGDENYDPHARYVFRYMNHIGSSPDVPIITNSFEMNSSYANVSYFKAACAYDVLRDILGKELFDNTLREYMKRWNGKHPSPYDFFYTFENLYGQDLSWFWKPWWFEYGVPDLAIQNVKQTGDILTVTVEKIGLLPVPIDLKAYGYTDVLYNDYKSANVWKNGEKAAEIEMYVKGPIYQVELGSKYIPDADTTNNIWYGR